MTGRAGKYVKALLPCLFFDVGDRQGRHAWADLVLTELGNVLQWVPYIIIMALGSSAPAGAIWGAVGSMTLIITLGVYRHAYAPQFPLLSWLEGGQWVGFRAMGIAWEATAFNYNLISPLSTSVLLGTVLASMAAGSPFTQQYARLKVDDETAATKVYLVMNYALSSVWAIVFAAMTACTWAAYLLASELGAAGGLVLGTILPVTLPLLGMLAMPVIVARFKAKHGLGERAQQPRGSTDDTPHGSTEGKLADCVV